MAQYDLNLRDYWRVLRKRKFIIIFTVIAMGIFSLLFSLLWRPVPLYKATASIKVEKTGSITGLYLETVSWSSTDYMQTQASVIRSYYIMEIAAKRLGLIPLELTSEEIHANPRYQSIVIAMRDSVETEQEGYSNILNISVTSPNPQYARRVANTVAQVFKEQHVYDLNRRTIEAKKFIENQLTVVSKRLRDSEEEVKQFRENNNLVSLSSQTTTLLNQQAALQAAYEKTFASLQKIEEVEKLLKGTGNAPLTSKTSFYIDEASTLYKNLNDQLVRFMLERDTLLLTYTDEYPLVVELNKKIRESLESMKAQLSSQKKIMREKILSLTSQMEQLDKRIKTLPELGLELSRVEEKVKLNNEIYVLLEKKYQEALIKEAEKIEEVQLVKPALEPTKPINPPKSEATAAVGTLLGLILGIVFAFVVETFDTSIGAIEEVEELTGVHALGIIPHVNISEIKTTIMAGRPGDMDDHTAERYSRMVTHFAPKSTLAESYRALRTNLKFSGLKGDTKSIAVTSSSPQEGKSTVVANLAITMAQDGKKVLLIDGDMRKPMIARIYGIEQSPGLADVILGNYSWKDVVRTVADIMMGKLTVDEVMMTPGMDNLSIITSGTIPPNPSELMSTDLIDDIIREAESEYDLILWDAPPILSATDATILASKVDGVVMVYRVGKIARNTLKRAKSQLDNVRANVIGVVLNGLKAEISPDFTRHDYYKYYDYYSDEGTKIREETGWKRLLPFFSSISTYFRKSPKEKPNQKTNATKLGTFLIALVLLNLVVLYQWGAIKLPGKMNAVPIDGGAVSPDEAVMKRSVETAVENNRSDNVRQRTEAAPSEEVKLMPATGTTVSVREPAGSDSGSRIEAPASGDTIAPGEEKLAEPEGAKVEPIGANHSIDASVTTPVERPDDAEIVSDKGEDKILDQTTVKETVSRENEIIADKEYVVRIGSYRNSGYAKKLAGDLRMKGLDAWWLPYTVADGHVWYRVFVGHFDTGQKAVEFMQNEGLNKAYPGSRVLVPVTEAVPSSVEKPGDIRNVNLEDVKSVEDMPERRDRAGERDKNETARELKYVIQIGTFDRIERAKGLVATLRMKGIDAQCLEFTAKAGVLYRVVIGRFEERKEALAYMRGQKFDKKYPDGMVLKVSVPRSDCVLRYVMQVASFREAEDARKLVADLRGQGIDAKWLEHQGNKGLWYRVVIGEFNARNEVIAYMKERSLRAKYPDGQVFLVSLPRSD